MKERKKDEAAERKKQKEILRVTRQKEKAEKEKKRIQKLKGINNEFFVLFVIFGEPFQKNYRGLLKDHSEQLGRKDPITKTVSLCFTSLIKCKKEKLL